MMSTDIALIDINSAINAMNSRNGRGNGAAVASEMGLRSGFKARLRGATALEGRTTRTFAKSPHDFQPLLGNRVVIVSESHGQTMRSEGTSIAVVRHICF